MSTSGIDTILTKVEKLSTEDKKLLIKRVVDQLAEIDRGSKPRRQPSRSELKGTGTSRRASVLDKAIAAYALRHGGSDSVDLDPELEAASIQYLLDSDEDASR